MADVTLTQQNVDDIFRVTASFEAGVLQGVEVGYRNNPLIGFAVDHATINIKQGGQTQLITDLSDTDQSNYREQIRGRENITTAVRLDDVGGTAPSPVTTV